MEFGNWTNSQSRSSTSGRSKMGQVGGHTSSDDVDIDLRIDPFCPFSPRGNWTQKPQRVQFQ